MCFVPEVGSSTHDRDSTAVQTTRTDKILRKFIKKNKNKIQNRFRKK